MGDPSISPTTSPRWSSSSRPAEIRISRCSNRGRPRSGRTIRKRSGTPPTGSSRQKPGGRVMNGLPGFRVDKELVERRLESLKRRGIRFRMGITFGQDVKLSELRREFDAVFLGFGLADAMPLDVPGAELRGVYQAFPFVSQNALPVGGPADQPSVDVRGKRVVVLGGGDTAMDVLPIAIRRGAAAALCLYRRDEARSEERRGGKEWRAR